jgi:hypothetical protein
MMTFSVCVHLTALDADWAETTLVEAHKSVEYEPVGR